MIALPPNFDEQKKYPLLVLMHGGPHSMWRDNWGLRWNYFMLARPGYVVLLTNYSGSTGFGEAFAQSIQGDPFKGPGKRDQRSCRRSNPALHVRRWITPGRGRRQLRRSPGKLDAGHRPRVTRR